VALLRGEPSIATEGLHLRDREGHNNLQLKDLKTRRTSEAMVKQLLNITEISLLKSYCVEKTKKMFLKAPEKQRKKNFSKKISRQYHFLTRNLKKANLEQLIEDGEKVVLMVVPPEAEQLRIHRPHPTSPPPPLPLGVRYYRPLSGASASPHFP
jgi:hypothetical protein